MTKKEVEKFLGQLVAITITEDDDQFLGVKGRLTKVTDETIQLDDNEDELCEWKLTEVQAIEPFTEAWNEPFAWLKDVK